MNKLADYVLIWRLISGKTRVVETEHILKQKQTNKNTMGIIEEIEEGTVSYKKPEVTSGDTFLSVFCNIPSGPLTLGPPRTSCLNFLKYK